MELPLDTESGLPLISIDWSRAAFLLSKRGADIVLSSVLLLVLTPLIMLVALTILIVSGKPILYWSKRYGRYNDPFLMPKFRTMRDETPELPTQDLSSPRDYIIPFGRFLRGSSFDEIPQLWSILCGRMSFIGPRPVILSEKHLTQKRSDAGVSTLRPGLSGWAQINGRDYVQADEKVALDKYYLDNQSLLLELRIAICTVGQVFASRNISH